MTPYKQRGTYGKENLLSLILDSKSRNKNNDVTNHMPRCYMLNVTNPLIDFDKVYYE